MYYKLYYINLNYKDFNMDKSMYKELIADLMKKESELKNKLQLIWDAVRDHPNDMELGGVIRNMFWDKRDISHDRQLDLFSDQISIISFIIDRDLFLTMGKRKKKKTLQQMKDYLNDKSLHIKKVSREFFMGADITTRVHKDKKKYTRKIKHKKSLNDE